MIFKSLLPSAEIPALDIPTFYLGASKANGATPDTLAYVDIATRKALTYGQLEDMHDRIASGLVNNLGLKKGDIVMIFASNSIYYAPAYFGILASGAVCCTASSVFNASEIAYQFNDCGAKAVFVTKSQEKVMAQAIDEGLIKICPQNVVSFEDVPSDPRFTSMQTMLSDKAYTRFQITTKEESANTLATIVYSSGTTGRPKGVMLSHHNMISYTVNGVVYNEFVEAKTGGTKDDSQRCIAILPFAHIYGLTTLVQNSVAGGKTQYILRRFSIDHFLQAIQDYRLQIAPVVPAVYTQILKHPKLHRYDLSSLRVLGCGAAPLAKSVHEGISKMFPIKVSQGFGMSETCSGIIQMAAYRPIFGAVGFLYSGAEAKFVDEHGKDLEVGQEGELCLRGSQIMMGYLNRPEENAHVFDKDGFFHTGDVGYINETGHVFITDRIKELIKYKGLQVSASELEDILITHEAVNDAAVIGVHDPKRETEVPMAYIVLADSIDASDKAKVAKLCMEVQAFLASKVAGHKHLRGGVDVIESIPRNVSGKILRRELKVRHMAKIGAKL
ncbi:hypothetical protein EC988_001802 [Linderina pennispora]|nr:hypothetical protein EC988_001802 [Linderina pennispora]